MSEVSVQAAEQRGVSILRLAVVTTATSANALLGFSAILCATQSSLAPGIAGSPSPWLVRAAWCIVGAWLCDMTDGPLARGLKAQSEFGAQLDSLCDAVSFGLAPAVIVATSPTMLEILPPLAARLAGAFYLLMALFRLARFNVHNENEPGGHLYFKGMPSPAAAIGVAALVLTCDSLSSGGRLVNLLSPTVAQNVALFLLGLLPVAALLVASLMVSAVRYPDLPKHYLTKREPWWHLVLWGLLLIGLGGGPGLLIFGIAYALRPLWQRGTPPAVPR